MTFIYIILGTILFLVSLVAGGLLFVKHYFQKVLGRLFGDNDKGSKTDYTRNSQHTRPQDYTNNTPHRQEGKIFSADEGEYIDFEEIKE